MLIITLTDVIGQSLDQIVERHYQAVGAKNIKDIRYIRYKGKFDNSYLKNFVLSKKIDKKALHPEFELSVINHQAYLLQIDGNFGEEAYAFSNGTYWRDQGGSPPEQWSPSDIDRLKIQMFLDIEGFLIDWKIKGYQLVKSEDIALCESKYHRLKLITTEKDTIFYYINPVNSLISKISFFHDLAENPKSPSYTINNYRKIKGFMMPLNWVYKTQMFEGPNGYQEMIIDKIKCNPKLNKKIFDLNSWIDK